MVLEPGEISSLFRYDAPHKLANKSCVQKCNQEIRKPLLTDNYLMYCPVVITTSKRHKFRTISSAPRWTESMAKNEI